ncbi:MAG: V-type ATP synthase subunit E [Firmicutes bacterium]|jgi:V/A-type H+-transporting ATPase subunit E|nr:V-type ATP synthase subunit E [Bacillota bacterium]
MQNLDRLKARIIDEAKARASQILAQADEKVRETLLEAKRNGERRAKEIENAATRAREEQMRRGRIGLALEERNAILRVKGDMIDAVLAEIPERLGKLPDDTYLDLASAMILSASPSGDVEIVPSPRDRSRITPEFLLCVENKLKAAGLSARFSMAREDADTSGGFILRMPNVEVDCSLEALRDLYRQELEPLVAQELFGGGDGLPE